MVTGKYKILYEDLISIIDKKRIFHDPLHTLAYGTDASFYRLIPKMVIRAKDENEVSMIIRKCSELKIPLTFRGAGTSLSGQAISDSVLVISGSNWKKFSISKNGEEISLQPGLTGGRANSLLAPYGRKIGPDPASINTAMIGGIAANNASGMCAGVRKLRPNRRMLGTHLRRRISACRPLLQDIFNFRTKSSRLETSSCAQVSRKTGSAAFTLTSRASTT